MKNLTKIFALAAIAVLAAISCVPEVEISKFDMERENASFDPEQNTGYKGTNPEVEYIGCVVVVPVLPNTTTTYRDIEISVTLDPKADVFREDDIGSALSEFLSFHKVVRSNGPGAEPSSGSVDFLSEPISFSYTRRMGDVIYIKLDNSYSVTPGVTNTNSPLVYKFDSTKYTFASGLKVDTDGNGISGEEDYDDKYATFNTTENYGQSSSYSNISLRENKNWSFIITDISNENVVSIPSFNPSATTVDVTSIPAASLSGVPSSLRRDVAGQFATSFVLQKYTNGSWSDYRTSELSNQNNVVFTNFQIEHLVPYRIVWKGGEDPTTTEPQFGFRQRLYLSGGDDTYKDMTGMYLRSLSQINGPFSIWNNPAKKTFKTYDDSNDVTIHSRDASNRNVIIAFDVGTITQTTGGSVSHIGLDTTTKDSFKFFTGTSTELGDEIEITAVAMTSTSNIARVNGLNDRVLLTLDPSQAITIGANSRYVLCVNSGLGYTDGITVFGNMKNIYFDFFDAVNVTF